MSGEPNRQGHQRGKYSVSAPNLNGSKNAAAEVYEEAFLYDLLADPHELTNIVGFKPHEKVRGVMRERLLRRLTEAGEAAPEIRPAPITQEGFQRRVSEAEAQS